MSNPDYIPVPRKQGGGRGRWTQERFIREYWLRVDRSGGPAECWPWTATRHPQGHGQVWIPRSVPDLGGRAHYAHRVAYWLTHGPIPAGVMVCHHCDNPPCCNPAHLYVGTQFENMRDMIARNRRDHAKGTRIPHAVLTDELVREIRRRFDAGESVRSIALDLRLSYMTAHAAAHRRSWRHVDR